MFPLPAWAAEPEAAPPAVSTADPMEGQPVQPDMPPVPAASESVQQPALTGNEYMQKGEESYNTGDYEAALDSYAKALPLLTDTKERAKAYARMAFIHAAFGQTDKSYEDFVESLKLDRGLILDPDLVSPKVYEAFVKARGEVVREGTLICNCDPSGADVYLDGVLLGEAPAKKEHIPEGEYTLMLRKQGYETSQGKVLIKNGVTLTVEDKLAAAKGALTVTSVPPGATVVLDGREAGSTPVTVEGVSSGSHTVLLKRDYFEPFEGSVSLGKTERGPFSGTLKRKLLIVDLSGDPSFRDITDGPISGTKLIKPVYSDLGRLSAGLAGRGLDPSAADFLKAQKARVSLEDSAVLSGMLETAGAELMLTAGIQDVEGKKALRLALYSTAGDSADMATLTADDTDGLKAAFARYLSGWEAQQAGTAPSIGVRVVDRAEGGVEVLSVLAGSPASDAGLMPGDRITGLDKTAVKTKGDLYLALVPGRKQKVEFIERGKARDAEIITAALPLETPVDSGDCLYNLAVVDYSGIVQAGGGKAGPDDTRGLAALNLGNAYRHFGYLDKAVKVYLTVDTLSKSGICTGTALYRLGEVYEDMELWPEAAYAYRKAMLLYPDATIQSAEGPPVAPLAKGRLKELFRLGLVKERWWQ